MGLVPPLGLLLNCSLIRPGERLCVAVSGGADSTALLLALHASAVSLGVGLSAAHLHHGIRGDEADADERFLRDLCAAKDVPLAVERAEVPALAAAARQGLEEAARGARLRFFDSLLQSGAATAVATAHTEDDQAETVMMKLLRGAWTEGLGGISPVLEREAGRIIRPLLNTTRVEVVDFLRARNQPWREDSSNQSPVYTRNRVRAQLMPLLKEFNPAISSTLGTLALLAREEEARWKPETARLLSTLALPGKPVRGGGRAVGTSPGVQVVAFDLERLRALDLSARRRLLRAAAERAGTRLAASDVARILLLAGLAPPDAPADATVPSRPNSRLDLQGGLRVERSLRELRFHKP